MKKIAAIVFVTAFCAYSYQFRTNFCAGLSVPVGEGSTMIRPGPSVSFEPNVKINEYFGIGGHIDYSWFSIKSRYLYPGIGGIGDHIIDIGFTAKIYAGLNEKSEVFFEIDPAFALDIGYFRSDYVSKSVTEPCFAMTYGTGFLINNFILGFKYKHLIHEFINAKWVNFYIGYSGG